MYSIFWFCVAYEIICLKYIHVCFSSDKNAKVHILGQEEEARQLKKDDVDSQDSTGDSDSDQDVSEVCFHKCIHNTVVDRYLIVRNYLNDRNVIIENLYVSLNQWKQNVTNCWCHIHSTSGLKSHWTVAKRLI